MNKFCRAPIARISVAIVLATVAGCGIFNGADLTNNQASSNIHVLSNRTDLISGGDALVEVLLPAGAPPNAVRVTLSGKDVTSQLTGDNIKCQLKPLAKSDYQSIQFTDAQWSQLQATFPNDVCDYSKPAVGRQPTVAWMGYSNGPGGRPLTTLPLPSGWASPSMRSQN